MVALSGSQAFGQFALMALLERRSSSINDAFC